MKDYIDLQNEVCEVLLSMSNTKALVVTAIDELERITNDTQSYLKWGQSASVAANPVTTMGPKLRVILDIIDTRIEESNGKLNQIISVDSSVKGDEQRA